MDVLVARIGDVECRFYVDPADGSWRRMEMIPEEDTDPCELLFRRVSRRSTAACCPDGSKFAMATDYLQVFQCTQFTFAPPRRSRRAQNDQTRSLISMPVR